MRSWFRPGAVVVPVPPEVTGMTEAEETAPLDAMRRPFKLPTVRLVVLAFVVVRLVKIPVTAFKAVATKLPTKLFVEVALVEERLVLVAFVATRLVLVALVATRFVNVAVIALNTVATRFEKKPFVLVAFVTLALVATRLVAVALPNVCPPVHVFACEVLRVTEADVAVEETLSEPSGETTVVVAEPPPMPSEEVDTYA